MLCSIKWYLGLLSSDTWDADWAMLNVPLVSPWLTRAFYKKSRHVAITQFRRFVELSAITGGMNGWREEEVDPFEVFNMFFGGMPMGHGARVFHAHRVGQLIVKWFTQDRSNGRLFPFSWIMNSKFSNHLFDMFSNRLIWKLSGCCCLKVLWLRGLHMQLQEVGVCSLQIMLRQYACLFVHVLFAPFSQL